MKTEKEIQARIDLHQANIVRIRKILEEAKVKFFKNTEIIGKFEYQILEDEMIIETLAWTLI